MSLLLAVVLGGLIGVSLGALGGGGSILTVPALVYALAQSAQAATTASLVIVGITSVAAAAGHARSGNVRWRIGLLFGVAGAVTSYGGSVLNRLVDPNLLLLAFAALMLVAAAAMLRRTTQPTGDGPQLPAPSRRRPEDPVRVSHQYDVTRVALLEHTAPDRTPGSVGTRHRAARFVAAAGVVGFLIGFLGVGGGFIVVPALVVALGFSMPIAVGTSLLVIAFNSAVALLARSGAETFHWAVIIPFTIAAVIGSLAGNLVADRVSGRTLTKSFAALLVAVAVYVAARSGAAIA